MKNEEDNKPTLDLVRAEEEAANSQETKRRKPRRAISHTRFKLPKWLYDPTLDEELAEVDDQLRREGA